MLVLSIIKSAPGALEADASAAGVTREEVMTHLHNGVLVTPTGSVRTDGTWAWFPNIFKMLEDPANSLPTEFLSHVSQDAPRSVKAPSDLPGAVLRSLGVKSPIGRFGI